jgi:sigma-B regulation protein RsbQ
MAVAGPFPDADRCQDSSNCDWFSDGEIKMSRAAIGLLFAWLLVGCEAGDVPVEPSTTTTPAAQTVLAPDGVAIHYDDQGEGELALVFIHGWNCDRNYWNAQREFFSKSHRVVTLDLAGHGDSDQSRVDWTMQAFGADVAAVVTALDLDNVVLIGHSMGGKVIVEAATQLRGRVVAVVGVDTFHSGGRATPELRRDEILEKFTADYVGFVEALVDRMFVEQSDPAIKEFVRTDMAAAPYASALGARNASGNYDATPAIASLDIPLILISSDYVPTDVAHLEATAKAFGYREMSGVGHFVMLEDPETFNGHLAAALADIT